MGNIDITFEGVRDQRMKLVDVSFVLGLGFSLYSLHVVQRTLVIVCDASGVYISGTKLIFLVDSSRSSLQTTS